MKSYYQMTTLEKWTEDLFSRIGVAEPSQISIGYLADAMNIELHYLDTGTKGIEASAGRYSMFLDKRLPPEMQRLEFLHELCHLLRHAGPNHLMPAQYSQAEEDEADRFILYATMPYSMISSRNLPELRGEAAAFLSSEFRVPTELAVQRVDQIQRRIFQGQLLAVMESQNEKHPVR
ncbi:ImmA/IrrE family metallo-endopeptidase [Paenibacillus sp. sgz500958]|uniref:ImmA/IrrE family metallo-endopeptidase n=1 Tax=Paenibacillus sp. sgz500958 TaxID=3242475 RepID=UPI0036D2D093